MKYGHISLGQIEAVINKLGGTNGVNQLLADQIIVKPVAKPQEFKVWKTITIGTFKNKKSLVKAMEKGNHFHGNYWYPKNFIESEEFTIESKERSVDLVLASAEELCFKGANWAQVYACAQELGLEICPDETACQLVMQYGNEDIDHPISIASKFIEQRYGSPGTNYKYVLGIFKSEAGIKNINIDMAELISSQKEERNISCQRELVFIKPRK